MKERGGGEQGGVSDQGQPSSEENSKRWWRGRPSSGAQRHGAVQRHSDFGQSSEKQGPRSKTRVSPRTQHSRSRRTSETSRTGRINAQRDTSAPTAHCKDPKASARIGPRFHFLGAPDACRSLDVGLTMAPQTRMTTTEDRRRRRLLSLSFRD